MKIITKKEQEKINTMIIKKLRFVARATLSNVRGLKRVEDDIRIAEDKAEQVFYADNVI